MIAVAFGRKLWYNRLVHRIGGDAGDSPSGKASGSGPDIRGFESLIPSHFLFVAQKMEKRGCRLSLELQSNPSSPAIFFVAQKMEKREESLCLWKSLTE